MTDKARPRPSEVLCKTHTPCAGWCLESPDPEVRHVEAMRRLAQDDGPVRPKKAT